jgi:hypothetical protein
MYRAQLTTRGVGLAGEIDTNIPNIARDYKDRVAVVPYAGVGRKPSR